MNWLCSKCNISILFIHPHACYAMHCRWAQTPAYKALLNRNKRNMLLSELSQVRQQGGLPAAAELGQSRTPAAQKAGLWGQAEPGSALAGSAEPLPPYKTGESRSAAASGSGER
jgi:hypothetical protein